MRKNVKFLEHKLSELQKVLLKKTQWSSKNAEILLISKSFHYYSWFRFLYLFIKIFFSNCAANFLALLNLLKGKV